jgi:hypothetical protein
MATPLMIQRAPQTRQKINKNEVDLSPSGNLWRLAILWKNGGQALGLPTA